MKNEGSYNEYAQAAVRQFMAFDEHYRLTLVNTVKHLEISRVLDVGCGAGQMLLPFLEETDAMCVGVDVAEDLGKVTGFLPGRENFDDRLDFLRTQGEQLPFADESFDLVLCRLAIPYMNNRAAIGEIARVLRPEGVFLLKTHAVPFYLEMIWTGLKALGPKKVAYPVICIMGGVFNRLTGIQPEKGFWKGKEVFQTRRLVENECARVGLRIDGELPDTNRKTPSYFIVKK